MKSKFKRILAVITSAVTVLAGASGTGLDVSSSSAATTVKAFPGAVGGGCYATGGRGGTVYHVTNLNDSGTGSFRDAVSQSNRIVVFDVSGTIELASNIIVSSNVTIAGQTAPGGSGITLKNYKLGMGGDNIICRYISSRPGPYKATSSGNDAWGGAKGSSSIIDHCSMSWTTDEQWGLYSNNEYYTVQYSIIGPADSWGGHSKGVHGFGLMMGKGYSTFDHNLIIHNVSRNFRGKVVGTETADFTNNVIYNWAYQTAYGTIGHLNYVNNTLKMGPDTVSGKHYISVDSSTSPENFKIYATGNRMLNIDDSIYDTVTSDNWNGISVKDGLGITLDDLKSSSSFQTTVNSQNVSTANTCESAEDSYNHVVTYAGNGISSDKRTAVDLQCANECKSGTGTLSGTSAYDDATDAQKETIDKYGIECGVTYTYPSAVTKKEITDADNDGMDDNWELARGLDPTKDDTTGDYCGQGYTNIEYYINDLTVNSFPEGVVTLSPTTGSSITTTPASTTAKTTTAPAVTTVTTTTTTAKQGATLVEGAVYKIKNQNSGQYMSAESASQGANVSQSDSATDDAITWRAVSAGNGYYYLFSQTGEKAQVLDIAGKKTDNGTNADIYTFKSQDNQQFKFILNDDGSYKICTKISNDASCVEVKDALTTSGANIQEWEINGATCQNWILEQVTDTGCDVDTGYTYQIRNKNSQLYLNVTNGTAASGTNIQQWASTSAANYDTWKLVKTGSSGYYYIYTLLADGTKYMLNVDGGVSASGANVSLNENDGTSAVLFKFVKNVDGTYNILTKSSKDKCGLDVADASTGNGANILQSTITNAASQHWELVQVDAIAEETTEPATTTTTVAEITTTTTVTTVTEKTEPATTVATTVTEATKAPETTVAPIATTQQVAAITEEITEPTTTVCPPPITYGDVNVDGDVSISDVVLLNKYLVKNASLSDLQLTNADTYKDGNVDSKDSLVILKFLVKTFESLPVFE